MSSFPLSRKLLAQLVLQNQSQIVEQQTVPKEVKSAYKRSKNRSSSSRNSTTRKLENFGENDLGLQARTFYASSYLEGHAKEAFFQFQPDI